MSVDTKLNQTGDTIVEVLIAIAVASSVLGIVFATSSRNLHATRDIQERSEATRLLQGQIEAFRYAYNNKLTIPGDGVGFCMNGSRSETGFSGAPNPAMGSDNLAGYPLNCRQGFYNFGIVGSGGTFTFYARWNSVTVTGRDQVIMVYKVN